LRFFIYVLVFSLQLVCGLHLYLFVFSFSFSFLSPFSFSFSVFHYFVKQQRLAHEVGLSGEHLHKRVSQLSGGLKRRLSTGIALVNFVVLFDIIIFYLFCNLFLNFFSFIDVNVFIGGIISVGTIR
jgi:hypothetical protein